MTWIDWCLQCEQQANNYECDFHNTTRAVVFIDDAYYKEAMGT